MKLTQTSLAVLRRLRRTFKVDLGLAPSRGRNLLLKQRMYPSIHLNKNSAVWMFAVNGEFPALFFLLVAIGVANVFHTKTAADSKMNRPPT
jgi:hypothetical protein